MLPRAPIRTPAPQPKGHWEPGIYKDKIKSEQMRDALARMITKEPV